MDFTVGDDNLWALLEDGNRLRNEVGTDPVIMAKDHSVWRVNPR